MRFILYRAQAMLKDGVVRSITTELSKGYPSVVGRLDTCYSPVRRSPSIKASFDDAAPRLAGVKPVASVHPEPGSNSSL